MWFGSYFQGSAEYVNIAGVCVPGFSKPQDTAEQTAHMCKCMLEICCDCRPGPVTCPCIPRTCVCACAFWPEISDGHWARSTPRVCCLTCRNVASSLQDIRGKCPKYALLASLTVGCAGQAAASSQPTGGGPAPPSRALFCH